MDQPSTIAMLFLMVLQVRLSCLLWGAEGAEVVVVAAGRCAAFSLVPALVWTYTLEPSRAPDRPHEKVLLDLEGWCSLLLQRLWVLLLKVLQVRLSCLLWGAEGAEVVPVAGGCLARSLVPALLWTHTLESSRGLVRPHEKVLLHWKQHWARSSLLLLL
jgi:hypothetical protein